MAEIKKEDSLLLIAGMVIGGLFSLYFGGKWVVDGAVATAQWLGISKSLISLTIVALGTSLPELVTTIISAQEAIQYSGGQHHRF